MIKILYTYILIINIISLIIMGLDKYKAIKKKRRISENTLLFFSIIGGSIGILLGMTTFRHKVRKPKFYILVPLIILIQIFIIIKIPQ